MKELQTVIATDAALPFHYTHGNLAMHTMVWPSTVCFSMAEYNLVPRNCTQDAICLNSEFKGNNLVLHSGKHNTWKPETG